MTGIINNLIPHYSGWLQTLTRGLVITNFFQVNGISEVVDLSRHDWNYLVEGVFRFFILLELKDLKEKSTIQLEENGIAGNDSDRIAR